MANVSIKINSNATKQMEALINKVDTFPNRIASAQQSGLYRSIVNISSKLMQRYPAAKYLEYDISTSGRLGYKMTIIPDKNGLTSAGGDAHAAASVLLHGRKSYKVRPKRAGGMMILRDDSVPPYPRKLKEANIPAMKGKKKEIAADAKVIIINNLKYALGRFGFGPRGGATGLVDLSSVRSRAGE